EAISRAAGECCRPDRARRSLRPQPADGVADSYAAGDDRRAHEQPSSWTVTRALRGGEGAGAADSPAWSRARPAPRERTRCRPDVDRMMGAGDRLLAQLKDPPTIDELAHLVGTNAFRLKRDFKAMFGRGIRAFVLAQRHEMARALLLDTRLSIKDIAARIGYSD